LQRLDVDASGVSMRTGRPAWPDSAPIAIDLVRSLNGERLLVLVMASWLEGLAVTTRRTYVAAARVFLRELCAVKLGELVKLPEQAALTWQRDQARYLMPRTVNARTAALNSLMAHLGRLRVLTSHWSPIPALKVTKGRWIDREAVVLSDDQLATYCQTAAQRPRRQFLALMLASLHGLRASEVAHLRWKSISYRRRGKEAAPAVLSIVGKGQKHRLVQVHPALRAWLERERQGQEPETYVLADENGEPPTPQVVGAWAADVFRRAGLVGYGHALRATWTTLALEHRGNSPVQVQASGGWKDAGTMIGHYFKRRNVPSIRLAAGHDRY
jgi:integrase